MSVALAKTPTMARPTVPADRDTTEEFDSMYDEPSPPAAQMARPTAPTDPDTTAEGAPAAGLLSNRRVLHDAME